MRKNEIDNTLYLKELNKNKYEINKKQNIENNIKRKWFIINKLLKRKYNIIIKINEIIFETKSRYCLLLNIKNLLFIPKKTNKGITKIINTIFLYKEIEFRSLNVSFIKGSKKNKKNG